MKLVFVRSSVLTTIIYVLANANSALACVSGEVRYAQPGVPGYSAFTCDTSNPSLGEAWKYELDGVTWGDLAADCTGFTGNECQIRTPYGSTSGEGSWAEMTYSAAQAYCARIGARLPVDTEFYQLAYAMGFRDPQATGEFKAQILAHSDTRTSLWSQSERDGESYGYPGERITGLYTAPSIENSRLWIPHGVRCVVGAIDNRMPPL